MYIIFLVFQLKSHAFMYESMPRHIVDAEAAPGPAATWRSGEQDDSDSCCCSDDDECRTTLRSPSRGRRGSSTTRGGPSDSRSSSVTVTNVRPMTREGRHEMADATWDDMAKGRSKSTRKKKKNKKQRRREHSCRCCESRQAERQEDTPRVDVTPATPEPGPSSPWIQLRTLRPATLTAMTARSDGALQTTRSQVDDGRRRSHADADRLDLPAPPAAANPNRLSARAMVGGATPLQGLADGDSEAKKLSRPAAVVLLVVTTALVATCAEYLVSSIEDVTRGSGINETFVGLVVLPIVGNAAEHITSVAVAMRNKMDLAIGVCIGSSIQIALLVTPLLVMLGWALGREMSLYFPLFETMCLFLAAFIVNFLVLDGRSNYMEGALLCAVYLIIGIVAFFYPEAGEESQWDEGVERVRMMLRA